MRRPMMAVLAAVLVGSALAPAGAAIAAVRHPHATGHPATARQCRQQRNPYTEPVAVLRSCGDTILPLEQVTALPGGGHAYSYGSIVQDVPPRGFNILRATSAQLREYGLPTRRQLGARWYQVVRRFKSPVAPRPYLVRAPRLALHGGSCPPGNCSWSGYAVTGHAYNQVSAQWFEPHFGADTCSQNGNPATSFAQWVGIGGYSNSSQSLGQDGTTFNVNGMAPHQAVIETIDTKQPNSGPVAIDLQGSPGQLFYAFASWNLDNQWYQYDMANDTIDTSDPFYGKYWSGHSRLVFSKDLSSAEVITEFPGGNSSGLSNYGQFQVQQADVTWDWGASAGLFGSLPPADVNKLVMYDKSGTKLSSPGSLTNGLFNMFWSACD